MNTILLLNIVRGQNVPTNLSLEIRSTHFLTKTKNLSDDKTTRCLTSVIHHRTHQTNSYVSAYKCVHSWNIHVCTRVPSPESCQCYTLTLSMFSEEDKPERRGWKKNHCFHTCVQLFAFVCTCAGVDTERRAQSHPEDGEIEWNHEPWGVFDPSPTIELQLHDTESKAEVDTGKSGWT